VRRRCRPIVLIDAGCDPGLACEDLGNAIRKIRVDFGISIEFDDGHFQELLERKRRWATATVRYSDADPTAANGRLLYIKPLLLGDEPADVRAYADAHPGFPHETTANQWFNEAQTESYRQLGLQSLRTAAAGTAGGPAQLFDRLVSATGAVPAVHAVTPAAATA
jgi:hypothetical protein